MQIVTMTARMRYQNDMPFDGEMRIELVDKACTCSGEYVLALTPQTVPFVSGVATVRIASNQQLGASSYYKVTFVKSRDLPGFRHEETKYLAVNIVIPNRDCDLSELATIEPLAPTPQQFIEIYTSQAKAAKSAAEAALEDTETARDAAAASASAAATSETNAISAKLNAETSELNASGYAEIATARATEAEQSSSTATTKAAEAATSAAQATEAAGHLATHNASPTSHIDIRQGIVDGGLWLRTQAATVVTCYPVPNSYLDVLSAWEPVEIPPAVGDKSSTNPSTITGRNEITVTRCDEITDASNPDYQGADYHIDLVSEVMGGSVNADGTVTEEWAKYEVTGMEAGIHLYSVTSTWTTFLFGLPAMPIREDGWHSFFYCSHFTARNSGSISIAPDIVGWANRASQNLTFNTDTSINTVDLFKSYLAEQYASGTPVTVVYKLATPITRSIAAQPIAALTQADKYTPRLNTIYSDADTVQVGYNKSPIQAYADLTNAIIAAGGATI